MHPHCRLIDWYQPNQGIEFPQRVLHGGLWQLVNHPGIAYPPFHASDMVGQDHARHIQSCRYGNLKWIPLDLIGDRTNYRQPDSLVVCSGGEDESRPTSGLLSPQLRIEIDDHYVAALGNSHSGYHHISLPTGGPMSVSP